jgi:glycosyltransferase involved in cell wall biosynthesis
MRIPADLAWETLVVNNGGTDHTDQVIDSFVGRLPIRRAMEPRRGLSNARNRAIDEARGDYIIWTDDDVVVDPGWLAAYADAFRCWPDAAIFGGRIVPKFEEPMPEWFRQSLSEFGGMLAARDFKDGDMPLEIEAARPPFGPNMAVRAVEQRRFRYDPALGLGPGQRRRGEETELMRRILKAGARGRWVPNAQVEHCMSLAQQTVAYLSEYFVTAGETAAYLGGNHSRPGPTWFGVSRWLWRRWLEQWLLYRFHRFVSPAPVWVKHLAECARARGAIRYEKAQRKSAVG